MSIIYKKLRIARERAGMTQEDIGTQIGRSKQWVSELERGNIRLTYDFAVKISAIYGKTPDYFLPFVSKKHGHKR